MQFSDREFKVIARSDKSSFIRLVEMIEDHPVFDRSSRHKQSPVWLQLVVVLNRLGCDGNGTSIQRTAILNGISYGSVKKFTERVFTAIRSLEAKYVYWPICTPYKKPAALLPENELFNVLFSTARVISIYITHGMYSHT
jgi:hypothetical protein